MKQSTRMPEEEGSPPATPQTRAAADNVIPFPGLACSHCDRRFGEPAADGTAPLPLHPYTRLSFLPIALQRWRQERDLKISAAAQGLGVASSTWGHWETGLRFPTGSVLLDLVAYTGLTLVELVCEHGRHCPLHHPGKPPAHLPSPGPGQVGS